ncbi:MAG: 50S ribosomal protein L6, partial [Candidatus Micrarchaeota archaeon]|nr:50S ribosomal protein L6 [Candidatus Micrarchaeota archaeon]
IVSIKGKLGSTTKKFNTRLVVVKVEGNKITITEGPNQKLLKRAGYATKSFASELTTAIDGVQNGIKKKMVIFYAHFPMTIEIKGKKIFIKNIFGEKTARETEIVGDTKVEVKGSDLTVTGVDRYDVGQTVGNIRKACFARGNDTRVFQDGAYLAKEE